MLRACFLSILTLFLISSCNSQQSEGKPVTDQSGVDGLVFGEAFKADGHITYDALLAKLSSQDSMDVKVVGKIEGVCQKKGCWMNIVSEDPKGGESMFVKFKDYGFFMPLDCSGRKVIMNGQAFREVTPIDELKHYAEDAKKPQEEIDAITEPKVELKFMASGVILLEEG